MRRHLIASCIALFAFAGATTGDDYNSPEWKGEISRGYLPYMKLTYDDFPINDKIVSPHAMHTEGFLRYSYRSKWVQRGERFVATVSELTVRSGFDQNKSWRRSSVAEDKALLAHEQGHLDISELGAAEFRIAKMPEGTGASSQEALNDLNAKVKGICERALKQMQLEQSKYDSDTNHGRKKDEQKLWSDGLRRQLDDQRIGYWERAG